MKYKQKQKLLCVAALVSVWVTASMTACNPYQQAKEAEAAKQTSDSILNEFKKVNNSLKEANSQLREENDSVYRQLKAQMDSISKQ